MDKRGIRRTTFSEDDGCSSCPDPINSKFGDRKIGNIILIFTLSLLAEMFLPWWSVALVAFAIGFFHSVNGWKTFGAGFAGIGLLWLTTAGYLYYRSNGLLTVKIAQLIHLPPFPSILILTVIWGGLVGGVSAVAGFYLRLLLSGEQDTKK